MGTLFLQKNPKIFDLYVLRGQKLDQNIGYFGTNYNSFAESSKIMTLKFQT